MDKFAGSRVGRRRLKKPAWARRECSIPGCSVPLWPPDDDKDDQGFDLRSHDMAHKNLSFSQVCFKCQRVFCRYHLSSPVCFVEYINDEQEECEPSTARLCSNCLSETQLSYILWTSQLE